MSEEFPSDPVVKNMTANAGDSGQSLGQEGPLEKEMATYSNILAWKVHGQRSLMGYNPWGCKKTYQLNNDN